MERPALVRSGDALAAGGALSPSRSRRSRERLPSGGPGDDAAPPPAARARRTSISNTRFIKAAQESLPVPQDGGGRVSGADGPGRGGPPRAQGRVRREIGAESGAWGQEAMEPEQVKPRRGHQPAECLDELQGIQEPMRGAIAARMGKLVGELSMGALGESVQGQRGPQEVATEVPELLTGLGVEGHLGVQRESSRRAHRRCSPSPTAAAVRSRRLYALHRNEERYAFSTRSRTRRLRQGEPLRPSRNHCARRRGGSRGGDYD